MKETALRLNADPLRYDCRKNNFEWRYLGIGSHDLFILDYLLYVDRRWPWSTFVWPWTHVSSCEWYIGLALTMGRSLVVCVTSRAHVTKWCRLESLLAHDCDIGNAYGNYTWNGWLGCQLSPDRASDTPLQSHRLGFQQVWAQSDNPSTWIDKSHDRRLRYVHIMIKEFMRSNDD